jgi:hypothetical protein
LFHEGAQDAQDAQGIKLSILPLLTRRTSQPIIWVVACIYAIQGSFLRISGKLFSELASEMPDPERKPAAP